MKFIQVGTGSFGRRWLTILTNDSKARLAAIVDVDPEMLKKAGNDFNIPETARFKDLKSAIKAVKADAVVCVTPPRFHRQPVQEAMRTGLHVITEKPLAEDLRDCRAMLKTASETGMTCVVSQNYRYAPPMWTLARNAKRIGEVGQVKIDFLKGVNFQGFRSTMPYPLLIDMSIHHFDLIRFITGLNPVSVQGTAWNPKWSHYKGDCSSCVIFTMENGARVIYNASWCSKGEYCDWNGNWHIEGTKGTLSYSRDEITINRVPRLYTSKGAGPVPVKPPHRIAQEYVLHDFMKAVSKGKRAATDVHDNIMSVSMVFAAVKAVQTGKEQPVLDKATSRLVNKMD